MSHHHIFRMLLFIAQILQANLLAESWSGQGHSITIDSSPILLSWPTANTCGAPANRAHPSKTHAGNTRVPNESVPRFSATRTSMCQAKVQAEFLRPEFAPTVQTGIPDELKCRDSHAVILEDRPTTICNATYSSGWSVSWNGSEVT